MTEPIPLPNYCTVGQLIEHLKILPENLLVVVSEGQPRYSNEMPKYLNRCSPLLWLETGCFDWGNVEKNFTTAAEKDADSLCLFPAD